MTQYRDMGVNLATAQDYVDTHQALMTDLKVLCILARSTATSTNCTRSELQIDSLIKIIKIEQVSETCSNLST